ncbi:hypothetical protein CHUAL_009345 [Chamberlinius hualienensis]
MAKFEIFSGRYIGEGCPCFIIAEIGQNHQGDVEIAKKLILTAKECGVDCVKFQKSSLIDKFTESALNRPYTSEHSWGATYGDHKQHLELSEDNFKELKIFTENLGIIFASSGMDMTSVDFLNSLSVCFFKIGSGDTNNYKLIKHAAHLGKPMIISSGMNSLQTMQTIYQMLLPINKAFCFLQCTSCYPTQPTNVNLNVIKTFQKEFPEIPIGYSGHEAGISISIAAVALGVKVIERHFTLNKSWKGSDHSSSLDADELRSLVKEIRVVEQAMGSPIKQFLPCEAPCYNKLGKSIVAAKDLGCGEQLSEELINVKVSVPTGIRPEEMYSILGKKITRSLKYDEPIQYGDLSEST